LHFHSLEVLVVAPRRGGNISKNIKTFGCIGFFTLGYKHGIQIVINQNNSVSI
jgi:hypothetical protein